jgi:hypothetical protein
MYLEGGTRDHFMRWLSGEFPHLVEGYRGLYAGKYAPASYRKEVGNVIGMLRKKYGISSRGEDDDVAEGRASDAGARDAGSASNLPPDQPIFEF